MLTANNTIHGWSPTGGDDEDVNVSQDMCFMTIRPFSSSSSTFLSPICPPLEPTPLKPCSPQSQYTPLSPLTAVSHSPVAPSSDRRAQRNRHRDPSWIPRPRNAFIIFRCNYSREHAQGSQDSQNDHDPTNPSVKTLSKRAADAWKQLSTPEKDRYKVLADKERQEHARLYPNYRFRPMKRQVSGTRKTSCERSQGPTIASAERPPAPSTHLPSVLASAPQKSDSSVERAEVYAPMPQVTAAPLPELSSYSVDPQADLPVALTADYNDPASVLFYSSPEATLPSDFFRPSVELYSPLCTSTASISPDTYRCNDSAFGLDLTHEDPERARALEAYAIGLYNFDLFSPFPFPESWPI
ncbi:hypothetical protein J3R82DRAFT_5250 [Butyriboletus roseoflavus]|nr:hypothetical protein J3R82DRAFT_5250 [Butyriboletus roseoflavus]